MLPPFYSVLLFSVSALGTLGTTGATGGVGRRVVEELRRRGVSVRGMVGAATVPSQSSVVLTGWWP